MSLSNRVIQTYADPAFGHHALVRWFPGTVFYDLMRSFQLSEGIMTDGNEDAAVDQYPKRANSEFFRYRQGAEPHEIAQFLTELDIAWGRSYKGLTEAVPYYSD